MYKSSIELQMLMGDVRQPVFCQTDVGGSFAKLSNWTQ
jgi:hypothetical protein